MTLKKSGPVVREHSGPYPVLLAVAPQVGGIVPSGGYESPAKPPRAPKVALW